MMVNTIDHLLVLLIAVVCPVYGTVVWFRRDYVRLKSGEPNALVRWYRANIIELWAVTIVILAAWFWGGRAMSGLGLGLPGGWGFWIGALVYVMITVFFVFQMKTIRSSVEAREALEKQLVGNTALLVPRTGVERKYAVVTSITAGICEEILYRAFFMWYLMNWVPGFAAVAISALVFGLAHVYQGVGGTVKATIAGLILGTAYLLTGSLWVPMALHATIDISSLLVSGLAIDLQEKDKTQQENE